jgi:hypothetical protein
MLSPVHRPPAGSGMSKVGVAKGQEAVISPAFISVRET